LWCSLLLSNPDFASPHVPVRLDQDRREQVAASRDAAFCPASLSRVRLGQQELTTLNPIR
jgi:hypothetical protein